jgi:hypothetical protein
VIRRSLTVFWFCLGITCSSFALDREAFTVTRYRLEVQIDRASHVMAVTGQLTLRNDSKVSQKNVALQVSSSLSWNGIAFNDHPVEWIGDDYTSDIDHTGHLSEAIATLPQAAPPGTTITLDVQYGGTVTLDATRLTRMGAPAGIAQRNDWDQVSDSFTAVRGLGYVVWYPVSIPAVSMSDGNTVFEAIDAWKLRHQQSELTAHISVIGADAKLCIVGNAMTSACGEIGETSDPRTGGVTRQISNSLHLAGPVQTVPVFAVADYVQLDRPGTMVFHTSNAASYARDYAAAAEVNGPLLDEWLGPAANQKTAVVELTDPNANPYQSAAVLFTPLRESPSATLELLLLPAQVAARFSSPRRWIEDGLQRFLQAVRVDRRSGRKTALQFLGDYLPPLLKAEEPFDVQAGGATATPAQPPADNTLLNTSDEILLRGKGSFVFWMLRDMVGDEVLQKVLAAYRPGADLNPAYLQGLLEQGRKRDLEWFFDDWVYRNRGLPEFRVDTVYTRPMLEEQNQVYLVTVTVENLGGAGAEVPVTIQTPSGERSLRVLVKAHQKNSDRSQVPAAPTRVVVNDGSVPEINTDNNTYDVPASPAP